MTEFLNERYHFAALAELDELLSANGIEYWLFGGWAVDFHVGRVTRVHEDIDIAIWFDDRARMDTLLRSRAWTHHADVEEDGYTTYERSPGLRLDVAYLERDETGRVYTPLRDGRAEWPADSFGTTRRQLRDVSARVLNDAALIIEKSIVRADAMTAAKDRADVTNLLHRI